jgi:PST family polysaccharide transporter
VAERAIRFVGAVALARLLSPHDFGLLAMLTLLTDLVISISDLGLEDALIQKRDLAEMHRSSVFWATLFGGAVLTTGLVAGAPWIAAFYGVEELERLAVWLSVVFLLTAAGTVPRAMVMRRLEFRAIAWLQCVTALAGCTCAVVLAWRGFGVMSLVADLLITAAVETALYFAVSAWRPSVEFRVTALRELFGFGGYRIVTRTLGYSAQHFDELLVGKFLGSAALGIYGRAFNLTRFPVLYVSRSIVRVLFPSLALIRDDRARVGDVYLRASGAVALTTIPMCMGLFAVAEPFVVGVFGAQWQETVPLLRIFCVASLVQSITTLAGSLYLSQGRADLQLHLTSLQRLSTIAAVVVGLRWGVWGVAMAFTLATALSGLPTLYFALRLVDIRAAALLARLRPVLLSGAVMTACVSAIDVWARPQFGELERLVLEVATGMFVYWAMLQLLRAAAYRDVIDLLRRPVPSTT